MKEQSPNVELIVSYADFEQKHHGGIYQATNWIYEGKTDGEHYFIIRGKKTHPKSIHSKCGTSGQRIDWILGCQCRIVPDRGEAQVPDAVEQEDAAKDHAFAQTVPKI
ncbi:MAG: hypothetical protein ACE3K2_02275 [Paenibacillus sp.]|uniref:Mom family adenine methylcarbamoylation protein n=1 Tax=Paenibacillus sp. TaxID=58172 RepID=UPI003B817AFE